ncbi:MAG TPA: anhydro-N-acetylmuramic acid kinase [Steroidobacteraceae bacterium]|jgi:anhydro-N-acetylmuramic acid kinase|nr:anhydro-N-acetylmuramic acid kinase [Steroidobacteraceae bacterium]
MGLMSGTSMDGIDAALLEIDAGGMRVRAAAARDWPASLQQRLRRAAERAETTGLYELGELDSAVGVQLALAAAALLQSTGVAAAAVRAIGSHGQTILHRPSGECPFTLQIGDPNVIAERLGIDVVADFRRRDVAAGGEGAPLMPAFHAAAFAAGGQRRAVVNIGGMANVTLLDADGSVIGFDTGPGNCLLDAWARRHLGQPYDTDGRWAASGRVQPALLAYLLADPYFARPAPKSTGRETFSDAWLERALASGSGTLGAPDVQATLAELTARSIVDALTQAAGGAAPAQAFVCGGGAFNADLMQRLARALPATLWQSTAACGIAPEHVEAAGFAWLAHRCLEGLAGNLPSVTGAHHPVPLGALYRGRLS